MRTVACFTAFILAFVLPRAASAEEQNAAVATLTQELRAQIPAAWDVRVRWRDDQLLASITPQPYQEAFDLWYKPTQLQQMLRGYCPPEKDHLWTLLNSNQDVILEPTVGGKSGTESRIHCRASLAAPS